MKISRTMPVDFEGSGQTIQSFLFSWRHQILFYELIVSSFCLMQKTVLAVLDKLIKPNWPYLPQCKEDDENQDEVERALSGVPDDPMNYDFFYHVLEADENGRLPKIEVATEVDENGTPIKIQTLPNPKFNHKSISCLRLIAESGNKVCVTF